MAVETVTHKLNRAGANTSRKPSGNLWGDCPWAEIEDPRSLIDGITFFDDFLDWGSTNNAPATQTTEVAIGRYKAFAVTAGIWKADNMPSSTTAGTPGGIISIQPDSDGDAAAIGTNQCPFILTTTQPYKLWFEARVATTSIAANTGQMFVGLGENKVTTWSATIPLGNNNATSAAPALIGFNRLENGLAVLNTSYADHATSWTDVQTTANSTLAANTWIKLGMKVDMSKSDRCVTFFVDNVECSTAMTKAALLALSFVDVSCLGPCMAVYADSGTSTTTYFYLDWWRCAQVLSP